MFNDDRNWVFQFIYKIPHNVNVGTVYKPIFYDHTFVGDDDPENYPDDMYDGPSFTIGAPYQ